MPGPISAVSVYIEGQATRCERLARSHANGKIVNMRCELHFCSYSESQAVGLEAFLNAAAFYFFVVLFEHPLTI